MDTKATTLLAKLFGNDGRTIPYRPEVARVVGGIGAAILLQQIVYRANGSNFEAFYKFKEPCTHHLYREGDSWTEELGFNRREFDNALQSIAVKHTAKVTMEDALKAAQEQHKPVLYWTNASRVTFYRVEIEILVTVLSQAYDQKRKSDFSKSAKQTLDQKAESDFIRSESSTRLPVEKDPPLADSHPTHDIDGTPLPPEIWESWAKLDEAPVLHLEEVADPPQDDEAETAAMFPTPPPREPRTAEDHKAAIRRALEEHASNGDRAGVADPTKDGDPWVDIAVKEWARISGKDFKEMSIGTKLLLAGVFRKVGAVADSEAVPVAAAIGRFPGEHKWWAEKVGFEWPSDNFCNKLGMMLVPDVEPELSQPTTITFIEPDFARTGA